MFNYEIFYEGLINSQKIKSSVFLKTKQKILYLKQVKEIENELTFKKGYDKVKVTDIKEITNEN